MTCFVSILYIPSKPYSVCSVHSAIESGILFPSFQKRAGLLPPLAMLCGISSDFCHFHVIWSAWLRVVYLYIPSKPYSVYSVHSAIESGILFPSFQKRSKSQNTHKPTIPSILIPEQYPKMPPLKTDQSIPVSPIKSQVPQAQQGKNYTDSYGNPDNRLVKIITRKSSQQKNHSLLSW